jgi:translation initiation factor 1
MDKFLVNTEAQQATQQLLSHTNKIHVRTQQFGRRWITTIEELDDDLDQKRIAKYLKRSLNVSVAVCKTDDGKEYIKLQGNQRETVPKWLVDNEVITEREARERLVVHGI